MNRRLRARIGALLMLSAVLGLRAQTVADSLRVSLLTCSPGTEVYQLYGHTALRVVDESLGVDVVFNYGVFDFRAPHFTWRFVLGQTDYMVAAYPYAVFLGEYQARGSSVTEQVMALTPEEASRLAGNLALNALPENRVYRYNFLSNNCTTRARDMIEAAVDGTIVYGQVGRHRTYRELLHGYTAGNPWAEVGDDLLLGADCDTVLSERASQFLPELLMASMEEAQVYDSLNNRRPLLAETRVVLPLAMPAVAPLPWHRRPLPLAWALLGLCLLVALAEWRWRRMWWGVDAVLMALQGLAGLLLCFMAIFSQHPAVARNWHLWVLNPLPLLCLWWVVRCAWQRRRCAYHYASGLVLALFVVAMPWIPQNFAAPMLPLALTLFTRPLSYYIHYNHR